MSQSRVTDKSLLLLACCGETPLAFHARTHRTLDHPSSRFYPFARVRAARLVGSSSAKAKSAPTGPTAEAEEKGSEMKVFALSLNREKEKEGSPTGRERKEEREREMEQSPDSDEVGR